MLVKKSVMPPVLKSVLLVSAVFLAGVNFAGSNQQGLQVAAVSDGFNAEQKYMSSCFACHSTGAAGAPKVGDGNGAEWTPRMEKGMDAVVTNAINGLNTMPPKGLCFDCNDDDLRAIVEYMVENST